MTIATSIRDQLVSTMREELANCPDPVAQCAEPTLEIDVDWGPQTPDGLLLKTDRGTYKVTVTVEEVQQ